VGHLGGVVDRRVVAAIDGPVHGERRSDGEREGSAVIDKPPREAWAPRMKSIPPPTAPT